MYKSESSGDTERKQLELMDIRVKTAGKKRRDSLENYSRIVVQLVQDTELQCKSAQWGAVPTNLGKQQVITRNCNKAARQDSDPV
jgi:hypothetical protein